MAINNRKVVNSFFIILVYCMVIGCSSGCQNGSVMRDTTLITTSGKRSSYLAGLSLVQNFMEIYFNS